MALLNMVPRQSVPLKVRPTVRCILGPLSGGRRSPTVMKVATKVGASLIPRPGLRVVVRMLSGPGDRVTRYLPCCSPRRCMPVLGATVNIRALTVGPLVKQLWPVPQWTDVLPRKCLKTNGLALTGRSPSPLGAFVPSNRLVHRVEQTEVKFTSSAVRKAELGRLRAK